MNYYDCIREIGSLQSYCGVRTPIMGPWDIQKPGRLPIEAYAEDDDLLDVNPSVRDVCWPVPKQDSNDTIFTLYNRDRQRNADFTFSYKTQESVSIIGIDDFTNNNKQFINYKRKYEQCLPRIPKPIDWQTSEKQQLVATVGDGPWVNKDAENNICVPCMPGTYSQADKNIVGFNLFLLYFNTSAIFNTY